MTELSLFLRRVLLADAVFSGVSAVSLTSSAAPFAQLFELPETLLRESGLFLILYTALVGWLATRKVTAKSGIAVVIAGNAAWTVASIALLLSRAVNPNLSGEIVVVLQAVATGTLAGLQYIGLRRSGGAIVI
jgi:hypothetical protein